MYVIKRIFINDLNITFRSKNVMIAQIRLHEIYYLHLYNVYNELNNLSFSTLQHLRFILKLSSKKKIQKSFHNERFQHLSLIMKRRHDSIE